MKTMLFNPYTGKPRDPRDIASDPSGLLMVDPDEPILAALPLSGGVQGDAAWQSINSMNLSDELVWLRKGDAIEGPRVAETDDYDRYAFWAPCEPPSSRQDPTRLERRLEICRHERMRAEFRADLHFKTLMGIFNLLNPEATDLGDGRIMKFVNPYANETLDKLSALIRSIKSDTEAAAIASHQASGKGAGNGN